MEPACRRIPWLGEGPFAGKPAPTRTSAAPDEAPLAQRAQKATLRQDGLQLSKARARELDPFPPRAWSLTSQILFDLGRDEEGEAARARFDLLSRVEQEARAPEGN